MAKRSRNPKPNHKQSGLETLKLGGASPFLTPSWVCGSQRCWNIELPPRVRRQGLENGAFPPTLPHTREHSVGSWSVPRGRVRYLYCSKHARRSVRSVRGRPSIY